MFSMWHMISLLLIYFIIRRLYLLTTFIQFPLPPTSSPGNHRSNLFFCEFIFEV